MTTTDTTVTDTDTTETPKKLRGRQPGSVTGSRPVNVTMASVMDGKLVHMTWTDPRTVADSDVKHLSASEAKEIQNSEFLALAKQAFEDKFGIKPEVISDVYTSRVGPVTSNSSVTTRTCPYSVDEINFASKAKAGAFNGWQVNYRDIEESEEWVYITSTVRHLSEPERKVPSSQKSILVERSAISEL